MKRKSLIIALGILVLSLLIALGIYFFFPLKKEVVEELVEEEVMPSRIEYGLAIDSFIVEEDVIQPNTFLSQVFEGIGVDKSIIAQLNTLDRSVFDVRSIRTGRPCKTLCHPDKPGQPLYWIYEKNQTDYVVFCFQDSLSVYSGSKPTTIETTTVHATITSSLWNATVDNGLPPSFAINLSEIYAWTIDFFGLQKGDSFSVVFDKIYVDSVLVGIGDIHATRFIHGDKDIYGFAFEQDSIKAYFDRDGQNLRKAFLKAPLNFSRISSHFTYARMHPVHRVVRPHTGVDYAAPMGTPVVSIGDGLVIEKGYKGGGGHTVKIKHNSVYTTAYLHLSKYGNGIQVGSRVSQGQVIGYVGSTGTSTGPHLDFRVWMNGKPINPLTMEAPNAEPIKEENQQAFDSIKNSYIRLLNREPQAIEELIVSSEE